MSDPEVEWVGTSCGKHGSYTFYKGFKLTADGQTRKYLLGEFYFVRNSKDRPICIAELQLVWHDANTGNQLASARLYFRPEATPGGRQNTHGKDELLYTDEKVVIKCRDMIRLECDGARWCYGMKAISEVNLEAVNSSNADGDDVAKYRLCKNIKKRKTGPKERANVVILSFPAYCRYQSLMKKLSNGQVLTKMAIIAFGGIIKTNDSTWISFSRSSFHHPQLDKFDFFNDNKAPVLKGRPRKKKADKARANKGIGRGKYRRRASCMSRDGSVGRRPLPESESSDDVQTDTSEDSSLGLNELPCPPKLVSAVKEEKPELKEVNQGVIRSVKQSSLVVDESAVIPPMPKLVKIEPKDTETTTTSYDHFRQPTASVLLDPAPIAVSRVEKIILPKLEVSCTKASVISSTYLAAAAVGTHPKPSFRPIMIRPQENATASLKTQSSREAHTRVPSAAAPPLTSQKTVAKKPSHVSRAGTIATNRNIQPRRSAIVCTKAEATARESVETSPSKLGAERSSENLEDWKQNLKRKRSRPRGGTQKYIKVEEGTSEERATTPLQQLEVDVSGDQVKSEPEATSPDKMSGENKGSSPESEDSAEREFITTLKNFMKKRGSPIEKIPALGFRKINLFKMFGVTRALGGYDQVTAKRLWRRVYNEVGGAPSITSAATNSRKHYERLLLPYERYMKGQDPEMMAEVSDPAPDADESKKTMPPDRDQNANVVLKKEPELIPQSEPAVKPSKPAVSVSEHDVYTSKPSVEFVTSGSRGSPVLLYTVDQFSRRRDVPSKEVARTSQSVRYESRPNVITSVGNRERLPIEVRSEMPKTRAYIAENVDDDIPTVSQKSRKCETKTSVAAEIERKHEYPPTRYELASHVQKEYRPRAQESRHTIAECYPHVRAKSSTPEITHESHDKNKPARKPGDGVLMMNVRIADEKVRSSSGRIPRQLDDTFMSTFSIPVFPSSHYQPGVEFYDLPSSGFPLRTSSRIFMPPGHQVFPGSSHPVGPMSPYSPHMLATMGREPGTLYQFQMPGFYSPELAYPLDTGVSILRI